MATSEHDGPQGIGLNDNSGNNWVACCSFPAATTLAQTWNVDLAYEMGMPCSRRKIIGLMVAAGTHRL